MLCILTYVERRVSSCVADLIFGGDIIEQYIETKSHWLPDFSVTSREGVVERHERGPLKEQKY